MISTEDDRRFEHLRESLQREFECHWRLSDRRWDLYKFDFTVVSALIALLVGLMTVGYSWDKLQPSPGVLAILLFLLGMACFVQQLNLDFHMISSFESSLNISEQMRDMLDSGFPTGSQMRRPFFADADHAYSIPSLLSRGARNGGEKTQLAMINSAVGASAIVYFFLCYYIAKLWFILSAFLFWFAILGLFHIGVACLLAKAGQHNLRYYGTLPPLVCLCEDSPTMQGKQPGQNINMDSGTFASKTEPHTIEQQHAE